MTIGFRKALLGPGIILAAVSFGGFAQASADTFSAPASTLGGVAVGSPRSDTAALSGVQDCYEGSCEIVVYGPTSIPLDSRFNVPGLSVTGIYSGSVRFSAANGSLSGMGSAGSTLTFNNSISIQILSVGDGSATIQISPL
jgi:hypothetical protein